MEPLDGLLGGEGRVATELGDVASSAGAGGDGAELERENRDKTRMTGS